jgi:hypothetical protein
MACSGHQGGAPMRSLKMVLILVMLTVLSATQAKARDRTVDDLLIGTAVGGMIGYIVGNEIDKNSYGIAYAYGPPAVYHENATYSHSPRRYYAPRHNYRNHYRDRYRDHYRSFSRSGKICREIVVVNERYGHYYKTFKTVCRDRGYWNRPHYRDRYYDRGYGRGHGRW